jgi:hypothetical protein
MGKVKQLWQDEIDQAIDEYHDEIKLWQERYGINYSDDSRKVLILKSQARAKKRLVSKLSANGCSADHIEEIVDCECR